MPLSFADHLKNVNLDYIYMYKDVVKILQSQIAYLQQQAKNPFRCKSVYACEPAIVDIQKQNNIAEILREEKNEHNGVRAVLVPCHVGGMHWVGILLEFDAQNKIVRSNYLDSLLIEGEEPNEEIQKQIAYVYPDCKLNIQSAWTNDDYNSCAVYTVENLIRDAQTKPPQAVRQNDHIRASHMQSLEAHDLDYYKEFVVRQKSKSSLLMSDSKAATVVPDNVATMFTTLIDLNRELDALFVSKYANQAIPTSELFQVVCDSNNQLRLRLREGFISKKIVRFLPREFSNDKLGFAKDYAVSGGILVIGGGASYATGLGAAEAFEIWQATRTIGGAARGMAAFANPWVLVPTLALTAGSAASTYESREFARQIDRAITLAETNDKKFLKEAEDILLSELAEGKDGNKSIVRRGVRWFSTPADQFQYARLVLAQIARQRSLKGANPYKLFDEVEKNSKNAFIKGLSIMGQINMLAAESVWSFSTNGRVMPIDERMQLLNKKVHSLNTEHKDVIKHYFKIVLQVYSAMFALVQNRDCVNSEAKFVEVKPFLDKLLNFQDLHCLRYMGEDGVYAEVAFRFLQAMCHVIHQQHYKISLGEDSNDYKMQSRLAQEKMQACVALLQTYKLDVNGASLMHTSQGRIVNLIQKFIRGYMEDCLTQQQQKGITPQWYMQISRLSPQQIEKVADNTLVQQTVTDAQRSAKKESLRAKYGE